MKGSLISILLRVAEKIVFVLNACIHMTHMGYHTLLALVALCNSEKFAIQWFRMHHIYYFKIILLQTLLLSG